MRVFPMRDDNSSSLISTSGLMKNIMLFAAVAILLAACASEVTAPDNTTVPLGNVRIERLSGATRLTNQGTIGLAYALWNPRFLGLMAVCAETTAECLRLAPNATVEVPDSEIVGAIEGDTNPYSVRIWSVVTNSAGQPTATEVQATTVNR